MFSPSNVSLSASNMFSAYASYAASMMMIRSMANEVIPYPVRTYLQSALHYIFTPLPSQITVVVDEKCGMLPNQVYEAAEIYLQTIISPSTERFKVGKTPKDKNLILIIEKGQEISDRFENINLRWKFVAIEQKNGHSDEQCYFELSFHKKFKERVIDEYFPFILAKAKEIKDADKVVKLFSRGGNSNYMGGGGGNRGSINLEHPSTFETLAMDPDMKKFIIDDLEKFLRRRDYYKKVGKAWKRGYLLYGPPGTGKSSLIAAMANYLKFDIYDADLTSRHSDNDLRGLLLSTTNRSIIVMEDIDCSVEMRHGRQSGDTKLTLSGMLNFIDGLWSSCGDERIMIFTTNHKEWLDPALLRPGRMDVHIHMSYCTHQAFKILALNYHGIRDHHKLFGEIEHLIQDAEVTPAKIAEELMKSDDADLAFSGVVELLKQKKINESKVKEENVINTSPKDPTLKKDKKLDEVNEMAFGGEEAPEED